MPKHWRVQDDLQIDMCSFHKQLFNMNWHLSSCRCSQNIIGAIVADQHYIRDINRRIVLHITFFSFLFDWWRIGHQNRSVLKSWQQRTHVWRLGIGEPKLFRKSLDDRHTLHCKSKKNLIQKNIQILLMYFFLTGKKLNRMSKRLLNVTWLTLLVHKQLI